MQGLLLGADRLLSGLARRLGSRFVRFGYSPSDLEQELVLQYLRRHHRHDPKRASAATFASHVCRNRAIQLLESAAAAKRGHGMQVESLSDLVPVGHEATIQREDTLSLDDCDIKLGRASRPAAELLPLRLDVERAIRRLPVELGQVARLLAEDFRPAEAARVLNISRASVYRAIGSTDHASLALGQASLTRTTAVC